MAQTKGYKMPVPQLTHRDGKWGVFSFTDGTFTPSLTTRMALRRQIEYFAKDDPLDGYNLAVEYKDWDAAIRIQNLYPRHFQGEKS